MVASLKAVNMGDIAVLKGEGVLSCIGLGSCIGLLAFDSGAKIAGLVHIVLPQAFAGKPVDKKGKFADTAVPELLAQLTSAGATVSRLQFVMAGGAHVFKFGTPTSNTLEVGARNIESVEAQVKALGGKISHRDVGGSLGRTIHFDLATGQFRVKTVSGGEVELCKLR